MFSTIHRRIRRRASIWLLCHFPWRLIYLNYSSNSPGPVRIAFARIISRISYSNSPPHWRFSNIISFIVHCIHYESSEWPSSFWLCSFSELPLFSICKILSGSRHFCPYYSPMQICIKSNIQHAFISKIYLLLTLFIQIYFILSSEISPTRTNLINLVVVAQLAEHWTSIPKVTGLIPTVVRQTFSLPGVDTHSK
jgi:hypothetical protein